MSYAPRGRGEQTYGIGLNQLVLVQDLKNVLYRPMVIGIDATALASTLIFTTDSVARFHPVAVSVMATTITTHTSVASLSVGTNATSYNDIMAITAQTGLTATNTFLVTSLMGTAKTSVAPSTAVYVKITTAAVGAVETYAVALLGYYEDWGAPLLI